VGLAFLGVAVVADLRAWLEEEDGAFGDRVAHLFAICVEPGYHVAGTS